MDIYGNRRLRIIRGLFITWACVIITQLANISFLGVEYGFPSQLNLASITLVLGLTCQILFQGPDEIEILKTVQLKNEETTCTIDRIYLHFQTDRCIRVISVCILLGILQFFTKLFDNKSVWIEVCLLSIAVVTGTRQILIKRRVNDGVYGTTQHEARTLLDFLAKIFHETKVTIDPPKGLNLLNNATAPSETPSSADYAIKCD